MKGVLHVSSANKSAVYLNVICFNGHFLSFELSSFYAATIFSLSQHMSEHVTYTIAPHKNRGHTRL